MAYYLENLYKPNPNNPVKQALSTRHNFRVIMERLNDLVVLVEATTLGIEAGSNNLSLGDQSLYSVSTGQANTAFGYQALYSNTTGSNNIAIGYQALYSNVLGDQNAAFGKEALYTNTGFYNVAFGYRALYSNAGGNYNVAFGCWALYFGVTGDRNTALGYEALFSTTGERNIALGNRAGKYETGSDAFYVNNQDRTNTVGDKSKSLLYGVMAAAAADQKLTVNGLFNQSVSKTPASASAAGTAGDICWDASYIYVCTAANSWERVGIVSW